MRDKGERKKERRKERENYLQRHDMRESTKGVFSTSTTVATIVILNTTTDATVTQDLQHVLFSSFTSLDVLEWGGGGDVRRSGELPTCYLLLSFPWSWSPATATPPHPSRPENWGGEASYVTACRRSRRRRGKDRESEISLTTQLRPQNRRRDTPILKNPQQWQPQEQQSLLLLLHLLYFYPPALPHTRQRSVLVLTLQKKEGKNFQRFLWRFAL